MEIDELIRPWISDFIRLNYELESMLWKNAPRSAIEAKKKEFIEHAAGTVSKADLERLEKRYNPS
jgi:hypothetical protein